MSNRILGAALMAAAICPAAFAQDDPLPKPGPARPEAVAQEPAKPQVAETAEAAIERALQAKTSCEFADAPLSDVVEYFRDLQKVNIVIDQKALEGARVDPTTPVTFKVNGVTFRSAIELALRPLKLTWTIHNEVLLITTPDEAGKLVTTKVYEVADLLAAPPEGPQTPGAAVKPEPSQGPGPAETPESAEKPAEAEKPALSERPTPKPTIAERLAMAQQPEPGETPPARDAEALADLITSTVAPASWDVGGGRGSISLASVGGRRVLVVSQSWQVHHQVARLLEELRKVAAQGPGR